MKALVASAVAVLGCAEHPVYWHVGAYPASRDVDILFVVENAPAMRGRIDAVIATLPAFARYLQTQRLGMPNLHVGIVTADLGGPPECKTGGDGGVLINRAQLRGGFLRDDGTDRNYTGSLADALAAQLRGIPTDGCEVQQPLAAMKRALDRNSANAGFFRSSAKLGVIVIADRDDCSGARSLFDGALDAFGCFRETVVCGEQDAAADGEHTQCHSRDPVAPYRQFLIELAGGRDQVSFDVLGPPDHVVVRAGNAGPELAPACTFADGSIATPAVRLDELAKSFYEYGNTFRSICEPDLESSMLAHAQMTANLGSRCIGTVEDTSSAPGIQPDCIARTVTPEKTIDMVSCGRGVIPCFEIVDDPIECAAFAAQGTHKFVVHRDVPPPDDALNYLLCTVPDSVSKPR